VRWPWERTPDEKQSDREETKRIEAAVREEMDRLHKTLDRSEAHILRELDHGEHG
jgi:hypothetical protein